MLKFCYFLIESDFYLSSIVESSEMRAAVLGRSSGCLGLFLDPLGLPLFLAGAAAGASCGGGATRMGVVARASTRMSGSCGLNNMPESNL